MTSARAKKAAKRERLPRRIRWRSDRVELSLVMRDLRPVAIWRVIKRAANDVLRRLEHNKLMPAERRAANLKRERDARYRARQRAARRAS